MTEEKVKLVIGSLLHDIGKVIYREGSDRRNHSAVGYGYLKTEAGIDEQEILECVKYHHASMLKGSGVGSNSLAYITYIADNIAAFADRRKKEKAEEERGFELSLPLQSVFNILNGNSEEMYYSPGDMDFGGEINFPSAEKKSFSQEFYKKIKVRMTENLRGMKYDEEYVNSLLSVLEANLSFMPSSTARDELADISLYDHLKLTAALASCIYDYLKEKRLNYQEALFVRGQDFYKEEAFMLCSLDFSGIQKFIYTITSKNALRTLRARSFYLEIMMEHMIDLLLERMELSRANLLYSGGGHCYLLLPGTERAEKEVRRFQREMTAWFLKDYRAELYVSCGYAKCTADTFRNIPEGSYSEIFRKMSAMISQNKQQRYCAEDIIALNRYEADDYSRECKVCKAIGQVDEEGVCMLCRRIEILSKEVLYGEFFTVLDEEARDALPLPGGYGLIADTKETLPERMKEDVHYVRTYAKNTMYTGKHLATKIWVGDYSTGDTFVQFAKQSEGIGRIGVLRADVDNLGQAFVAGFENSHNGNRYVTLSRTAALSRQLSLFFKYLIRFVLENGEFSINGTKIAGKRKATIIYSGGDDLFIVGAWNEVIELAIDLREKFHRYTQGTLSLSAGIGIYDAVYPVIAFARECGDMESEAKRLPGKNAVTILEDGQTHEIESSAEDGRKLSVSDGVYSWKEFKEEVIGEKYRILQQFLTGSEERGMTFLYRMLELIRRQEDKINFARFVYLIARLEPTEEGAAKEHYRAFAEKMLRWIRNEKDCRQLKTAMNLYAYMNREKGESEDAD